MVIAIICILAGVPAASRPSSTRSLTPVVLPEQPAPNRLRIAQLPSQSQITTKWMDREPMSRAGHQRCLTQLQQSTAYEDINFSRYIEDWVHGVVRKLNSAADNVRHSAVAADQRSRLSGEHCPLPN